jgi:hypothetical protein
MRTVAAMISTVALLRRCMCMFQLHKYNTHCATQALALLRSVALAFGMQGFGLIDITLRSVYSFPSDADKHDVRQTVEPCLDLLICYRVFSWPMWKML